MSAYSGMNVEKKTRKDTAKSGDSRTMSGRAQGSKFEGGLKCQLHTQESGEFFCFLTLTVKGSGLVSVSVGFPVCFHLCTLCVS